VYAGRGDGHECAGCGEAIDHSHVEYEVTFPDSSTYRLHLGCAALWDAKVRRGDVTIKGSRQAREQSQATRESARETSKKSRGLRARADLLAREAEATIDERKRMNRGETSSTAVPEV
jgi:hypothetical protein